MIKFWVMYRIFNKVWPCIFFAGHFLSVRNLLIAATTWCSGFLLLFRVDHSFCMWHPPIRKHLKLSFIWGHYQTDFMSRHLVLKPVVLILFLLHHAEDTRPGRNSSHDSLRVAVPSPTPAKKREGRARLGRAGTYRVMWLQSNLCKLCK